MSNIFTAYHIIFLYSFMFMVNVREYRKLIQPSKDERFLENINVLSVFIHPQFLLSFVDDDDGPAHSGYFYPINDSPLC